MLRRRPRAVITGMGVVAPNGVGLDAFWETLLTGRSGIRRITRFDPTLFASQVAGEISDFDPQEYVNGSIKPKRVARHTLFALAAMQMAIEHSGIDLDGVVKLSGHIPVIFGVSSSAFDLIERGKRQYDQRGPMGVSAFVVQGSPPQSVTAALARYLHRPVCGTTLSTGCPAGIDAIGSAADLITSEQEDFVIAGGTDAPITELAFATMGTAKLASTYNDFPEKASRPFDRQRTAGVISEGAGAVIVENLEAAIARGATPICEICGHSTNADDDHDQAGAGLRDTMEVAMANASLHHEDIDYICAHGPGHPLIDRIETEVIKALFGRRAYEMPISSIKGVTGNPLAAAGPMQVIAAAKMLECGRVVPTANLENPDPHCDLDYVPGFPRDLQLSFALINTHGLGGSNTSMVLQGLTV